MRAEEFSSRIATAEVLLRILSTSDLHMSLLPYDYDADAVPGHGVAGHGAPGLAGVAAAVTQMRALDGTCLLFDCGDFLQGGPMADYLALHRGLPRGTPHPMIAAMNLLRYDAATLGNHDFSYGLEFLERALQGARFPVVSANLRLRDPPGAPVCPPHAVLAVPLLPGLPPLRVGVIGFAPPQLVQWEEAPLQGRLSSTGVIEAACAGVPLLRAAGVDLVVALLHGGLARSALQDGGEHAALPLAQVPGIDVLLLGHAHDVFPGPRFAGLPGVDAVAGQIHGRPAVMPGVNGSHLGVVELALRYGPDGWQHRCVSVAVPPLAVAPIRRQPAGRAEGWTGARPAARSAVRPTVPPAAGSHAGQTDGSARQEAGAVWRGWGPAPGGAGLGAGPQTGPTRRRIAAQLRRLRRIVAPFHAATRAHIDLPLGTLPARLHTHFAQIADGAALRLVGEAQRAWAAQVVAGTPQAGLPIVAAVAPFRAGGRGGPGNYTDIPAGTMRVRHLHDLYPFPNGLRLLRLSGADLVAWLERTAALYARLVPGAAEAPLLQPEVPAYGFDTLCGASYALDLSAPPRFTACGQMRPGAGGRVRDLRVEGRPLAPAEPCLLVTSSYRAAGGGRFPGTGPGAPALPPRGDARTALLDHIRAQPPARAAAPALAQWRLTGPPGALALFDTAPAAAAHLDEIADLHPEALGLTPAGFLRLRLRF